MPARAAEVATMCGSGWIASSELTQTTAASPCAALMRCSCGWIVRVGSTTEKNLRRSSSVQAASSVSAKVETRPWPALLTSIATAPSFSSTAAAKACTCSCDSTSQTDENNFAAGKRARSCASTCCRRSWLRPQKATAAPASSNSSTVPGRCPKSRLSRRRLCLRVESCSLLLLPPHVDDLAGFLGRMVKQTRQFAGGVAHLEHDLVELVGVDMRRWNRRAHCGHHLA